MKELSVAFQGGPWAGSSVTTNDPPPVWEVLAHRGTGEHAADWYYFIYTAKDMTAFPVVYEFTGERHAYPLAKPLPVQQES